MASKLVAAACVVCGLSRSGFAALVNTSFEDPHVSPATYTTSGINGWSTSSGFSGVFNIPRDGTFTIEAPDGDQMGYLNGNYVAQKSTDVLKVGTTTLSVKAGRRTDSVSASFELRLWAGSNVSAGLTVGGALLGSVLYDVSQHAHNSFSLVSLTYTAAGNDAHLGQLLTVQMVRTSGTQMDFDDVRLRTPLPEPAAWLTLGLGGTTLLRRRRR